MPEYANPDTVQKIEEAREEVDSEKLTGSDKVKARRDLAREDTPDPNRPDLSVKADVTFRGHEFTFTELGESELEAMEYRDIEEGDIEQGTKAAEYIYRLIGKHGVGTDEQYWRQYSMQSVKGEEGLLDLFNKIVEEFNEEVDPEVLEESGNLPEQTKD